MQALTLAISPSGIEYLTQQTIASLMLKALSSLVPPDTNASVSKITMAHFSGGGSVEADNVVIKLTSGSFSNFSPAFQSVTQNENGQFTIQLQAPSTVNYSWNEQYDKYLIDNVGDRQLQGHINHTWAFSMGISTFTITVPVTLSQQPGSYTLTVGTVQTGTGNYSPNIPNGSIIKVNTCFTNTVDSRAVQALESIDFSPPIQNSFANLFGTIPASGHLTPDIVFNFNKGDTPLAFPNDAGMSLGVTGNVTWQGNAYSGGTPPSLGMPSMPKANHVHFYASDYEFNELFWAFYKDGRLNTTITSGQLTDKTLLYTSTYANTSLNALYQKYPNLYMTLDVTPQSASTVTFKNVYDLVYGDNGVLTTQEVQLPVATYTALQSLGPGLSGNAQGSVYLTQASYQTALQSALGSNVDSKTLQQIEDASVVIGPFSQVYQVTQNGLNLLQQNLPSGVYNALSSGLTVGQVFVDKAWLLVAIENALNSLALTNQYASDIEAAFALQGNYKQLYWVTPGTNGALSTLVNPLPADVYNALAGLGNVVFEDQTSFVSAVQNAIGSDAAPYIEQITSAAQLVGAIVTQALLVGVNVIKGGQSIPAFTVRIDETNFQQNFHLGIGPNNTQTIQFDFQLINGETEATLVSSNIPGINVSDFTEVWNLGMHDAYQNVMRSLGRAGVPLPFMAGFQFLFDQATVAVQPGYTDVLTDVEFIGTPAFIQALAREPGTADLSSLLRPRAVAAHGTQPGREPTGYGKSSRLSGLSRTRTALRRRDLYVLVPSLLARLAMDGSRKEFDMSLKQKPGVHTNAPLSATETFDFHLALGHIPDVEQFHLIVGAQEIPLKQHSQKTLSVHASKNKALGLLHEGAHLEFTHYVEGVELPAGHTSILRVMYPSQTAPISELALMAVHIPLCVRTEQRRQHLPRTAQGMPVGLALRGITTLPPHEDAVTAANDADHLLTATSTAASLVFMHPQLSSTNASIAGKIMDNHINSPDNITNIQHFQSQISRQGANWQTTAISKDKDGNVLTWGPGFSQAGQPVYHNQLSQTTITAAGGAMTLPLTTSQQPSNLEGACWNVNQGVGAVSHISPEASSALRTGRARAKAALTESTGYSFTVNNLTPGCGLTIDDNSMDYTPDPTTPSAGTITINVGNSFLRTLSAYVQYLDDHDKVIPLGIDYPGDYQLVDYVSSSDVFMGIPLPNDPTVLSFPWIAGAAKVRLVHGGMGLGQWDNHACLHGACLTGVFNYLIPGLFLLAGAGLDETAWFKAILKDDEFRAAGIKIILSTFGAEAASGLSLTNIASICYAFMDASGGFLVMKAVGTGLEKLQKTIIEKLTESALEKAIPAVNVIFQIANRAMDLEEMLVSTIEILCSPAVYEVDIVRTLNLRVTVSPDPTHGTSENPAVWPLESVSYEAIVQYQGGTAHQQSAGMAGVTSSQPIKLSFDALPAGGSLQVKFNVYSATGFLCGQFTGAWIPAALPEGSDTLTVVGSIQENLIPLTASTLYQYKQKLVYNQVASAHMWQASQFTLDVSEAKALDQEQISTNVSNVFQQNGCTLSTSAKVDVLDPGNAWTITDGSTIYRLAMQQEPQSDGKTVTVLMVNTANVPLKVVTDLSADDTGHNLAKLVNITMNDKAYMLGYCWRASGQNIPETGGQFPVSTQIHAFQNINVLAQPEASLKFSASGFVNQPAIVYDQFGPAPLFSIPSSFSDELDKGGAVATDLATLFEAFTYPLPSNTVATVVTQGASWTIGGTTPTYSLVRVTDVIEIHPYPFEPISQRNFYVQPTSDSPTSYQYQLRQITLDNKTPFDMNQTQSFGLFTLPFNDDFVVHPQGYVIAISYSLSRMMILKLPDTPSADDKVVSAILVSGPAGDPAKLDPTTKQEARQGLMNGPCALAVTADGRVLVLEQGLGTSTAPARIQSFDVNGNPVPSFDGSAVTTLPTSLSTDLDAGLVSVALRQAFATAGAPLSSIWLIRAGTTVYRLSEEGGNVVVTSDGANLSTNWTVTSQGTTYQLSLQGSNITVAKGGATLFTMPASVMTGLNQGTTTEGVADAFSQHGITLVPPISLTGDQFTLDPAMVAELVEGKVPSSLSAGLTVRGLPQLPATATVTGNVSVTVREPGKSWTLQDQQASSSYKISLDTGSNTLAVVDLLATAPLHNQQSGITYISMSTERKGYIYVLSYTGDGSSVNDYGLDIYQPNGTWLARTAGVNAAKIVVDMWRNLYTLNYESFQGPGGRTEPSVSTWTPSS